MKGYKLRRQGMSGWVFCGTTIPEILDCVKNELEAEEGMSADECDIIGLYPCEISMEEIDNMPDFEG